MAKCVPLAAKVARKKTMAKKLSLKKAV